MSVNVHGRTGSSYGRPADSKSSRPKSKSGSTAPARQGQRTAGEKRAQLVAAEKQPGKITVQFILDRCQETVCVSVFEIELQEQHLESVPNLSEFTRLRILDLSCNRIKSINNLDQTTDLKDLKLYSNEIAEITGLERLKELSNLHLQHNKIQTIGKGLQVLKKLKVLRIDNNKLCGIDHREIGCCSQLTVLDMSNNGITDIAALNSLSCLEELDASNNRIVKVPDLGRCKKLQEVDISRNQISEMTGFKGCPNLMILKLNHNCLSSLNSLGKLRKLQELYVSNNRLSRLEPLAEQFPSLEILDVTENILSSFEEVVASLSGAPLLELYMAGNPCISRNSVGHHQLLQKIPSLEIVDGVSLKRPSSSHGHALPTMRPLSASQILSTRQVEEQLKSVAQEQAAFEASLSYRFSVVRDKVLSLPLEPPRQISPPDQTSAPGEEAVRSSSSACEPRPNSRCCSRARIAEAQAYASEHFSPSQD